MYVAFLGDVTCTASFGTCSSVLFCIVSAYTFFHAFMYHMDGMVHLHVSVNQYFTVLQKPFPSLHAMKHSQPFYQRELFVPFKYIFFHDICQMYSVDDNMVVLSWMYCTFVYCFENIMSREFITCFTQYADSNVPQRPAINLMILACGCCTSHSCHAN